MRIDSRVIDELLKGYPKPEDTIGESGRLQQLTKAVPKTALNWELTHCTIRPCTVSGQHTRMLWDGDDLSATRH